MTYRTQTHFTNFASVIIYQLSKFGSLSTLNTCQKTNIKTQKLKGVAYLTIYLLNKIIVPAGDRTQTFQFFFKHARNHDKEVLKFNFMIFVF